jgi:hypothetical protein
VDGDDEEVEEEEEEEEEEEGWKTRAPGLKKGLKLEGGECTARVLPCLGAQKRSASDRVD